MDAPSSLWIVLDAEGRPEFAAGWREAAHEHIKDAIEIEVDETASLWVVREYTLAEEVTRLRAEAEALRADAERYRWLAASCRSTSEHWGGRWSIVVEGPAPKYHDSEDHFDAAIDAARAAQGDKT